MENYPSDNESEKFSSDSDDSSLSGYVTIILNYIAVSHTIYSVTIYSVTYYIYIYSMTNCY